MPVGPWGDCLSVPVRAASRIRSWVYAACDPGADCSQPCRCRELNGVGDIVLVSRLG
jgi:hypothetical protein